MTGLRWKSGLLLLLAVSITFTAHMCGKLSDETDNSSLLYLNHHDTVDYVGMNTCLQCHTDKHTFKHTGMGQSFDLAHPSKSSAVFSPAPHVYDTFLDLHYTAYWRDSSLWMLEYRLNGADTIHALEQRIDFIVGSGQHTNSHLFLVNDMVFQAPMTWYAQMKKWDLPPGFENGNNSRFSRMIDLECMSCHNSMPQMVEASDRSFDQIGRGIDCERCHGPGELHVHLRQRGQSAIDEDGIDRSIVHPGKLSWERQIDLCQRCHLQGLNLLKPGKSFADFRPGMPLRDVFEIYLPHFQGGKGKFDMANHAQRLQMSACFQSVADKGGITCISCHNPHLSVKVTGKGVFNEACMKCHQYDACSAPMAERAEKEDYCASCHMPSTGADDIPHVTVHDHYIRKPLRKKEFQQLGMLAGLYSVNNSNPRNIDRLRAYLAYYEKFDKNEFYLNEAQKILNIGGVDEIIHYYYLKADFMKVRSLSEAYLNEEKHLPWTCYRLGEAMLQSNQITDAVYWLSKAADGKPDSYEFMTKKGIALAENRRIEDAKAAFQNALKVNPNYALAMNNLATIYMEQKHWNEAILCLEKCIALHPDNLNALENLLSLYAFSGKPTRAIQVAKRILQLQPENKIATESLTRLIKVR